MLHYPGCYYSRIRKNKRWMERLQQYDFKIQCNPGQGIIITLMSCPEDRVENANTTRRWTDKREGTVDTRSGQLRTWRWLSRDTTMLILYCVGKKTTMDGKMCLLKVQKCGPCGYLCINCTKNATMQLIVPKEHVLLVLEEIHGWASGAHLGVNKTFPKVCERWYWVHCREEVEKWCRKCALITYQRPPLIVFRFFFVSYAVY